MTLHMSTVVNFPRLAYIALSPLAWEHVRFYSSVAYKT